MQIGALRSILCSPAPIDLHSFSISPLSSYFCQLKVKKSYGGEKDAFLSRLQYAYVPSFLPSCAPHCLSARMQKFSVHKKINEQKIQIRTNESLLYYGKCSICVYVTICVILKQYAWHGMAWQGMGAQDPVDV